MQLYDKLLQFPLFQGMSHDNLEQIAGHTKFGFLKIVEGQKVVEQDTPCNQMYFLLTGTLKVESWSDDHSYAVIEQLSAPCMLQPEAIFGYNQRFTHTYITNEETSFITIGKDEITRLTEEFLVFRLNILNLYATMAQKQLRLPWRHYPETLQERIVRFLSNHCLYPAGPKTFRILMTQLAKEVGDSRLDVSRALNQLQEKGLLQLHRGRIEIPRMERLTWNNIQETSTQ